MQMCVSDVMCDWVIMNSWFIRISYSFVYSINVCIFKIVRIVSICKAALQRIWYFCDLAPPPSEFNTTVLI